MHPRRSSFNLVQRALALAVALTPGLAGANSYLVQHRERLAAEVEQNLALSRDRLLPHWQRQSFADLAQEKVHKIKEVDEALKGLQSDPHVIAQEAKLNAEDKTSMDNYLAGLYFAHPSKPRKILELESYFSLFSNLSKQSQFSKFSPPIESIANERCAILEALSMSDSFSPGKSEIHSAKKCGLDLKHPWRDARMQCLKKQNPLPYDCIQGQAKSLCADSQEQFLNAFDIQRATAPPLGRFDRRLKDLRTPELQGKSMACAGFALTHELHNQLDRSAIFSDLAPSINSFQLYHQINSPFSGCDHLSEAKQRERALLNKDGTNLDHMMINVVRDPVCLPEGQGRIQTNRSVSMGPDLVDFNFLFSLLKSGQGAMVSLTTSVALDQEEWIQYGCREVPHVVYMSGLGRGLNPFTLKEEEYVVVKDSFRNKIREYKVPFSNFKKVLSGIYKVGDLRYLPESPSSMAPSQPNSGSATSR